VSFVESANKELEISGIISFDLFSIKAGAKLSEFSKLLINISLFVLIKSFFIADI
jgi:hypothetical protein